MGDSAGRIALQPIGPVREDLLDWLAPQLEEVFRRPVEQLAPVELPAEGYDPPRGQYLATTLLRRIRGRRPEGVSKLLGITEADLYASGLSFFFGEAYVGGEAGVISLRRLDPVYYGNPPNPELMKERMLKEAIHELGHAFGLGHCPDSGCIMHYSNTIEDTDRKGPGFCPDCQSQIPLP